MYEVVEILLNVLDAITVPGPTSLNDIVIVDVEKPCILNDNKHDCPG